MTHLHHDGILPFCVLEETRQIKTLRLATTSILSWVYSHLLHVKGSDYLQKCLRWRRLCLARGDDPARFREVLWGVHVEEGRMLWI